MVYLISFQLKFVSPMTKNIFNKSVQNLRSGFRNSIGKVNRNDNTISWSKEEFILERLQHKLGKSREDVTRMMSKNLLDLLAMVPFSTETEAK